MDARPHRPAPYPDLTGFIDAAGGQAPTSPAEIAAATAAVLLAAGREDADGAAERFVALSDQVGIETIGALWRDSDPVSLPGVLWAVYLLRHWFRTNPDEVQLFWRAGGPLAPAETAVAGVAEPQDSTALQSAADAVLRGVYRGDLGVALERAAALFRVVAAGRRDIAAALDPARGAAEHDRADRHDRAATDLAAAARRWRRGALD